MEIDESSKTIESTTPNMRNIFSNPQLNSTTERSASTEKPKTIGLMLLILRLLFAVWLLNTWS